jgi:hypothetical protein
MRRLLHSRPNIVNSNPLEYNPLLKYLVVDEYTPSIKGVIIDVVYSMIFSHHVPALLKHGGFMGNTNILGINSVADFLNSYVGKILFFFMIFYTLNFIVIPIIKNKL